MRDTRKKHVFQLVDRRGKLILLVLAREHGKRWSCSCCRMLQIQ